MKRHFFFALVFPPAFMDLMLVQTRPSNLAAYFVAGFVIATVPALLVALIDEALIRHSLTVRAAWCAVAAFASTPFAFWFFESNAPSLPGYLQTGGTGALVAFLCVVAFARITATRKPALLMLPAPAREQA